MSSPSRRASFSGQRVTVMGLGLNGGGIEVARFLARRGAEVTVTDLRDETVLTPSIRQLADLPLRYVLGRHEDADFETADLVIKNPAVRPGNRYIGLGKRIETDLSLFLQSVANPIIAVTGSKGKSTTASAIHFGLLPHYPGARLGGNITISPLSFIDDLSPEDPIVLELSSFQLGDLALTTWFQTRPAESSFPPHLAVLTSLYPDHQDYYGSMEAYLADKARLFQGQSRDDHVIFRSDDQFSAVLAGQALGKQWFVDGRPGQALPRDQDGAYLSTTNQGLFRANQTEEPILPAKVAIIGAHQRGNLLQAALALRLFGLAAKDIADRLAVFPGIEHRLEVCGLINGVRCVNDSAATIPEAALGAVRSFSEPVHLITGGTDKALTFESFLLIAAAAHSLYLLKGTATDRIIEELATHDLPYFGPFDSLEAAVDTALANARPGSILLLSPGCASFGLFLNEFDRGRKFKTLIANRQANAS